MKLSDFVMQFVADQGVKHVFMLPGGGAMHLNDSLRRTEGLDFVCNLHEQASAISAEAYCRVTENLGVALVTTGPGGTNAVTGVACAYLDSTPCLFISGQVKRSDLIGQSGLRQLGVQEIDIVSIVKPITKFAVTVMDPNQIRAIMERAVYEAKSGRPGPVWIDIPLDVQASDIEPDSLPKFVAPKDEFSCLGLAETVKKAIDLLNAADRPVLLAGNGVRVAGALDEFEALADRLGIPILTTCPGLDLVPECHPLLVGRPGAVAPRGANFALQNSDCLISIGARLDMAFVGYSHQNFARSASKVIVDVDPAEIEKLDMTIAVKAPYDAKQFIEEFRRQISSVLPKRRLPWLAQCKEWKSKYPAVTPEHHAQEEFVSTYAFTDVLSHSLDDGSTLIVGSSGAAIELVFLCLKVKPGQRIFHNRGTGSMGLGLPQAIGACFAKDKQPVVLVEGDGSFQLNIQELQTIVNHNLPIKIFILNNDGFASIRLSQQRHFGELIAADASSGMSLPNCEKLAAAFGFPYRSILTNQDTPATIAEILQMDGPAICEVFISPEEPRAPSLASRQREDGSMMSSALEDLWPFLPREEFLANMLVPALEN